MNTASADPGDIPIVERIAHVTEALRAYERGALDGQPTGLPSDPISMQALVAAFLCDLEHFASANDVDFTEAAVAGHDAYADEIAAARRYAIGDAVQLRHSPYRRGTISDIDDAHTDDPSYLVKVPGLPFVHCERAVALEPAPPFPAVQGMYRVAATVKQAEAELIDAKAHLHLGSTSPGWTQTYNRTVEALTAWSGCTSHELLTDLKTQINRRVQQLRTPVPSEQHPAALAAHDLADQTGSPSADADTAARSAPLPASSAARRDHA
ncbi:hypothetical protein [Actinomadura gamaensis]|uniref:Uncharacterized protein n=1 Tax=Actinomadura gamaensis TaxID=1763541 RepID=A0ABV9TS74_9ACTN